VRYTSVRRSILRSRRQRSYVTISKSRRVHREMGDRGQTSTRPAEHATRIVFFIAGLGMAAWAPLVPYAKMRLDIGDGTLGLVLLSVGVGSIVAMPIAGALAARFGCRVVITVSAALLCSALPFLATVADLPTLALFLVPGLAPSTSR
jgi:MFS family permease